MKYLDNLNHEICIGDLVFCLTGKNAKTLSTVKKFGQRSGMLIDFEATVVLENKKTLRSDNVISLSKLGLSTDKIEWNNIGKEKYDALGHAINIGDKVLFLHSMECQTQTGVVIKMSDLTCILKIPENRFGQSEYRQKYGDIINLSAIGHDNMKVLLNPFSEDDRCLKD